MPSTKQTLVIRSLNELLTLQSNNLRNVLLADNYLPNQQIYPLNTLRFVAVVLYRTVLVDMKRISYELLQAEHAWMIVSD